ncbi:MAG: redoxin family protein [Blastomonas sp.]
MRKHLLFAAAIALSGLGIGLFASQGEAAIKTGARASNFILTDSNGKSVKLADYRGKTVILEWHNPGCPFVQKHYNSGNMQKTQAHARDMGVVWLTINSGAKGKQGYLEGSDANSLIADQGLKSSHYLFDRQGHVGKAYGATTTPHMFIIGGDGDLIYQGGIDDKPTANPADIARARNHVAAALDEIAAGKAVSVASSRPYGCSVKYAS